jgi:peptide/nickel transport system permease protein
MLQYIARRLLLAIPVVVGVTILVFCLSRVLPGDIFTARAGTGGITTADRNRLKHEAGLDRPLLAQYLDWASHAFRLDLGDSLWNRRSINKELGRAIPITLELTVLATAIGVLIAVPLGVLSATMQGRPIDYVARFCGVLGLSVPTYVLGTLTITYLAKWFQWTPPAGGVAFLSDPWRNMQQFLIPSALLGAGFSAAVMRMTRSSVLGVLHEDYVRTAWAKGLRSRSIVVSHVVRNALIPVTTLVGAQVGYLLGGTVIIESIFNLSGVGSLAFDAITNRDYFMLQAVTFLAAVVFTVVNLTVDISYAWLDPRIRYG